MVTVIFKTLYIAFFSPAKFEFFLSCYCLFFFFFYYSFSTIIYTANLLQQLIMVIKFPCKICNKAVANNHHAVQCDKSHIWVHIKCNKINLQTYEFLQKSPSAWYCIKCFEDIVPFGAMRNSLKKNKDPELSLLSLQKTTIHLARILSINSMRPWMTLHLQQFPASTMSSVSFHL